MQMNIIREEETCFDSWKSKMPLQEELTNLQTKYPLYIASFDLSVQDKIIIMYYDLPGLHTAKEEFKIKIKIMMELSMMDLNKVEEPKPAVVPTPCTYEFKPSGCRNKGCPFFHKSTSDGKSPASQQMVPAAEVQRKCPFDEKC